MSLRCFVAADPPTEVRARLMAVRRELESAGADVRWARDEGLHCTLKFLGAVVEAQLPAVSAALAGAVAGQPAFDACVRGIGAFGARVVWARLEGDGFAPLAGAIDATLAPLGFAVESRPFRAHITLGRMRSRRGVEGLLDRVRAHCADDLGAMRVERVVLYASRLQRGGSVYTPLHAFALGRAG